MSESLDEFINNYRNKMEELIRNKQEELLIRSIIDIYNNVYKDYESYYKDITDKNNIIDEQNFQFNPNKSMIIQYGVKAQILPERIYKMIIKIKEENKND